MLSRIAGLVRDITIATIFGSKDVADAFFVAFKIPNLFRTIFGEGAFSQAFVPLLADAKKISNLELSIFVARISGLLASILIIFVGAIVLFPDLLTSIVAYGYIDNQAKYDLTKELLQITIIYLFFVALAGLYGSVLNTYNKFLLPAASPILLNLSFILFAANYLYFDPHIKALAYATFSGGALQLCMQLYGVARLGLLKLPRITFKDDRTREFFRLIVPGLYGVSIMQINVLIDTIIATFLVAGSVSWYYYSNRLVLLPVGVFGVAIATVVMPKLSMLRVDNNSQQFAKTIAWSIKFVLSIGLPATVALLIINKQLITTIFGHGAITEFDISMISWCMLALTIGLLGFMLLKVFSSIFYSHKDIKTPVKIATICLLLNIVLNFALALPLHYHYGIGHVGLALATSVTAIFNNILLLRLVIKKGWYQLVFSRVFNFMARLLIATSAMAVVLLLVTNNYFTDFYDYSAMQRVAYLAIFVVLGLLTFGIFYYLLIWRNTQNETFA